MSTLTQRFHAALAGDPERGCEALRSLQEWAARDPYLQITARSLLMSRPAFLTASERDTVQSDLSRLVELLLELPDRLFGGDVTAMPGFDGRDAAQRTAVQATWRDRDVVLARADLLRAADGFKAVEVNVHSSLGGIDSGPWHQAFLRLPVYRDFIAAEGLGYLDPMDGVARALREATDRRNLGSRPTVAVVDWPTTFPEFADRLHGVARLLEAHGFSAFACHAGELELRDGRLVHQGRPIDVLYRIFLLGDVSEAPELLDPILQAHAAGNLLMAMSFSAEVAGNKASLALLSAAADDGRLAPEDAGLVRRLVPWTRLTEPGCVRRAGEEVPLLELAVRERTRLVLKPADGHAGHNVVTGWTTPADEWATAVEQAIGSFYVLQERVRPVAELMPRLDADGLGFEEVDINWGVFVMGGRYCGAMPRATPSARAAVISAANGAAVGCCFSES